MEKAYTASLSRSQGRQGWAIIFRHPIRIDRTTGKTGLRVRRGLGTTNRTEAVKLVDELNEILQEPAYWDVSARSAAERRFDSRIVEIFYHALYPEPADHFEVRDVIIPLPADDGEYRRVLLVGTTGAGKTTVVRQLLGTDPENERFPSTSTGRTTVADMEIILDNGPFRAVVTFLPLDQVRDYVEECMSAVALAVYRGESQAETLRRLLNHVSQRFRLSYILGRGLTEDNDDDEDFDEDAALFDAADPRIDLDKTNSLLTNAITRLKEITFRHAEQVKQELQTTPADERVLQEIFEEELEHRLHDEEEFQDLGDEIIEEIERRFEVLTVGEFSRSKQGWPKLWAWETNDRPAFLSSITRFTSNHAKYFGTLLSPLVSGVRVSGPFKPDWAENQPKIVILDGEGLGHTPDASTSIPTTISRRFDHVDVVLLVDNAAQPMQAAPVVLMTSLAASGITTKLMTCFTHMDVVRGDNLPTFQARKQHVLLSAEGVLRKIGEQLGRFAERALRQSLQRGCFFVAGIDHSLNAKSDRRTVDQLLGLLIAINAVRGIPEVVGSHPIYDRVNLVLAVKNALEKFHEDWLIKLGFNSKPGISKEHWTRVKALSRRLAEGWDDEYDTLKPVADLYRNLQADMYIFVQNPIGWDGPEPNDDEKQHIFDNFAQRISDRALDLASRRMRQEPIPEWQGAYNLRGVGSTFRRAATIKDDIYERAAPVPDVAPSPDRNKFLHDVIDFVAQAADELEIKLR